LKKHVLFLFVFMMLCLLAACSSSPSLELVDADVKIVKDKKLLGAIGITEGERKGEELIPTALYYDFTIKNTSKQTIGSAEVDQGIEVKIVPKEKLKSTVEKSLDSTFIILKNMTQAESDSVRRFHRFFPLTKKLHTHFTTI